MKFNDTMNDTISFRDQAQKAVKAGAIYQTEIGDCNVSHVCWFTDEAEAFAAYEEELAEAELAAESDDWAIQYANVTKLGVDEDGDHDRSMDETLRDDA
jgi:hypothetical protein